MGAIETALEHHTERILAQIHNLPAAVRQTVADQLWSQIPLAVTEANTNLALAPGVFLDARPQTGGLELITSIHAVVPTGATGTITLGSLVIPVGAGLTPITPVAVTVSSTDIRRLVITGATGAAFIMFTGKQEPTYGVLAN